MDDTLYLPITRGSAPRPILATSDPVVIRAVARALLDILGGPASAPVLKLARELDPRLSGEPDEDSE